MRKFFLVPAVIVLAAGLSGCGSGPDGIYKQQVDDTNELANVLGSIKDDASAEAAFPKLEKLKARMSENKKKMEELKLSNEEKKKIEEKFKDQGLDAATKVFGAMVSVGDAKLSKANRKKLDAITKEME